MRKVSHLYSFIPATHRRNSMTDWDLWLFSPKQHLLGRSKGSMSQKMHQKTRIPIQRTSLLFYISISWFLCSFKLIRQTTMRNEIDLSKVFVTWVFVAKARASETIAHKLVNTRIECSPFAQFISWEMTQATTLLLICFHLETVNLHLASTVIQYNTKFQALNLVRWACFVANRSTARFLCVFSFYHF